MIRQVILSVALVLTCTAVLAQSTPIYLWKDVPAMENERTRLYVYNNIADSINTRVSVIICPGGSYHHLGLKHEGYNVAEWFNSKGITAFILRYRVGFNGYKYPAMIEDVQRAIQYVHDHSDSLKINPNKIGVMGFSAGGHLVTMAASFHSTNLIKQFGIETGADLKPNFVIPVYPVVSMQNGLAHERSRNNLLGRNPCKSMIDSLSLEKQIPNDMPPTLIIAAKDDQVVNPQNSVELCQSLEEKGIIHKLVLLETGGHGFGIGPKCEGELKNWSDNIIDWLSEIKML